MTWISQGNQPRQPGKDLVATLICLGVVGLPTIGWKNKWGAAIVVTHLVAGGLLYFQSWARDPFPFYQRTLRAARIWAFGILMVTSTPMIGPAGYWGFAVCVLAASMFSFGWTRATTPIHAITACVSGPLLCLTVGFTYAGVRSGVRGTLFVVGGITLLVGLLRGIRRSENRLLYSLGNTQN